MNIAVVLALVGHAWRILIANQRGQFTRFIVLVGKIDIAGPIVDGVLIASFECAIAKSTGRESTGFKGLAGRALIDAGRF